MPPKRQTRVPLGHFIGSVAAKIATPIGRLTTARSPLPSRFICSGPQPRTFPDAPCGPSRGSQRADARACGTQQQANTLRRKTPLALGCVLQLKNHTAHPKAPVNDSNSMSQADAGSAVPGSAFPIVGLGASAGGLEALSQLQRAMPTDTGMGFIIVQHLSPTHPSSLAEILLVHKATGLDVNYYKPSTLHRRIKRRMLLHKTSVLQDDEARLRDDPAEAQALYQDILISVTSFFCDPKPFAALSANVFPSLLSKRSVNEPLRIWTLACSSGEEEKSHERHHPAPRLPLLQTRCHHPHHYHHPCHMAIQPRNRTLVDPADGRRPLLPVLQCVPRLAKIRTDLGSRVCHQHRHPFPSWQNPLAYDLRHSNPFHHPVHHPANPLSQIPRHRRRQTQSPACEASGQNSR
ncbi:hypothetical protein FEM03_14755 [Phragmitibacter flavus]|uniref:CheR-type methyltransferase domain-containing protein n=1 Tax=Phragmitibacter flavus TaxID=2576071 RepID=A0A5R8KCG1_9BACT|nr:hypothetical protein FEM03_14755 [Phragmitibacter flavus]